MREDDNCNRKGRMRGFFSAVRKVRERFALDDAVRGLVGSGRAFAGFYFLEEPDNSYAEETKEREPAEDIDEGPVSGLTL